MPTTHSTKINYQVFSDVMKHCSAKNVKFIGSLRNLKSSDVCLFAFVMLQVSATCDGKLPNSDSVGSLSTVGAGGAERENHDHVHLPRDSSIETIGDTNVQSNIAAIAQISIDQCGLPLMLFTQVG